MLRNEKGFTLIEIIAVLVILGILAAVAIPKYLSMMDQSRQAAAQTAVAELKARASNYYASQTLSGAIAPTTNAGVLASVVALASGNGSNIIITITSEKGSALSPVVSGTWFFPQ